MLTGSTKNLINGVSRQPAEIRLTSQLEESINQFPTSSNGLKRRNPALLKGIIHSKKTNNAHLHLIDRDSNEKYIVSVDDTSVKVFDIFGNEKRVYAPSGFGYLAGATSNDIEAMTVADHTFILNKRKIVQSAAVWSPREPPAGLVHIVQGDYQTTYTVFVNGYKVAEYTTGGGGYKNEGDARAAERGAKTSVIAERLVYGTPSSDGMPMPIGIAPSPNLVKSLPSPEWSINLLDNVICITNNYGNDFSLAVNAGSDNRARAHKGSTADFSKLPTHAPNGFRICVSGSKETEFDDYYVMFEKPYNSAEGHWKETIAPACAYQLDASTMPHILVREANGDFTFKPAAWSNREVGDEQTNPWPSFVRHNITGMVFFKNRIGFTSGESVAMSRHNDFFNFFIESVLSPLDTDPVDVSISYPEISNINFAVPFSGEMLMFTQSVPFRLASGDTFTPKNVSFEHLLSNRVSSKVRPVAAGSRLFFINDVSSGVFVHELIYDRDVGVKEADCISEHVQGYIPSGVTKMETADDLNVLCLISDSEPNVIYMYKWLWIGNQRAQSAWQKWVFQYPISAMKFFGEELILVTDSGATQEILSINCHETWQDNPSTIYLDRRIEVQGRFDATNNQTIFDLPWQSAGATLISCDINTFGQQPERISYANNQIIVEGNCVGNYMTGFPYESSATLSPLLVRTTNNQGDYGNAVAGVKTIVTKLAISFSETVYLDVELNRDYRQTYVYHLSAAQNGTKTGRLGCLTIGKINKPLSIMADSADTRIKIKNCGAFGFSVLGYRWTGRAYQTAY